LYELSVRRRRFVVADRIVIPVAELTGTIITPASHETSLEQRTGMIVAAYNLCDGATYGNGVFERGKFIVSDRTLVSVAELAVLTQTPAADRTSLEYCACMDAARGDIDSCTANIHVARGSRSFVVANGVGISIA
jgi:hypothetical protein